MNKADQKRFQAALGEWFAREKRPMPWRETADPYEIWLSEVMLQQTRVDTVIPYYHRFLSRFPTVTDLAGASLQQVLKLWEGLGYYARARHLHRAAKIVAERYNSEVPDDPAAFAALPGVGPYTVAAVMSIAFEKPLAAVDGNVKRVLSRVFLVPDPVNDATRHKKFDCLAEQLLDRAGPKQFNQAMMELGAAVCTVRAPKCQNCPVAAFCRARAKNAVGYYPKRIRRGKIPTHRIAAGVVRKGKKLLITQRKPHGLLGGLWEFPGGKIGRGETAEAACAREIREEVNLEVQVVRRLTAVKHAYTHFKIVMEVFECAFKKGRVQLNGPAAFRWVSLDQLGSFPFPGANNKFIPLLAGMFSKS